MKHLIDRFEKILERLHDGDLDLYSYSADCQIIAIVVRGGRRAYDGYFVEEEGDLLLIFVSL